MKKAPYQADPLPPWVTVDKAIAEALPNLRPLARVSVSETAPLRSIEAGGQWVKWRPDVAPYMNEPGDLITSRRFDSVAFVGPARSSKSEGLVINPLTHAILAQPRVVSVFSPTKDAAQEWSVGALDSLIANSPELRERLLSGKGGDNVFGKKFRGGCRLTIDWPVKQKLAQRSISLVVGTDYDAFPDDIGGDGEAFPLMRKRTEAAGSRGMTAVESSPRKPILNENWTAKTPHEAPPCEGIVGIYNRGSRGRLYWTCPDCSGLFQPTYDRLAYPDEGSPADRGAGAYMVCPHCGGVIEARQKAELNALAQWLHECEGGEIVPIHDLKRNVATASFWLPGPAAALAPWSRIVSRVLEAEETYSETGGETALRAAYNVELGLPYLSRARGAAEGLTADALRDLASLHPWQECPPETRFVTVAVDVQSGRFVVQVEAWGQDMERVVIDRFDLFTPVGGDDGRRLDPAKYAEDWLVLEPLANKVYPVTGAAHGLRPLAVVIDMQGEAGVTPNARTFWRDMKSKHRGRFFLQRGRGGDNVKRAALLYPETAHKGKDHVARDVPAINTGTDRLKDEIAASLLRTEPGPRKLHISAHAPAEVFDEFAAERRGPKGWEPRPGVKRNEALDLSVYALALAIVLEIEAVDWEKPPAVLTIGPDNPRAVPLGDPDNLVEDPEGPDVPAPQPKAKARRGWGVRRGGSKW
ncbi:phage terminase large subunit family protein [Roseobacter sp. YSTF-M11]|uniref:Phage terminase large subunit family protein n=1 Tax=Roseobacter insulae TaxID=2859783 RepID=A0A9X1FYW7_9RHOB|nr:terminase gpA endonuclease subunit [Roseobacter insulae]MBW4709585.1 phage terminase large subunit family protein [Roseobacter insulae]